MATISLTSSSASRSMPSSKQTPLIRFLQEELFVPAESIAIALRQENVFPDLLPMVLWQYGLITLEQLDRVFDWLETTG